jgi:hypothetical protein
MNEKSCFEPLLEKLKRRGIVFNAILADAQYDSSRVRKTVEDYGAEPVIPHRRSSKPRMALRVGRDFVV